MVNEELKDKIKDELGNLERLVDEMTQLMMKVKEERDFIVARAAGSILHDFYCGIEKIFEKIAVAVDKNLPKGEDWHKDLLFQMGKPLKGLRDKVISEDLMQILKKYLLFRHLFRHIYGFELKWERIKPLCLEMGGVLVNLKREINQFITNID